MNKPTRKQAIKIIDRATDKEGFDDWWMDMMDDFGLYDEKTDTAPSLFDVFEALGIPKSEAESAIKAVN